MGIYKSDVCTVRPTHVCARTYAPRTYAHAPWSWIVRAWTRFTVAGRATVVPPHITIVMQSTNLYSWSRPASLPLDTYTCMHTPTHTTAVQGVYVCGEEGRGWSRGKNKDRTLSNSHEYKIKRSQ